MQKILHMGEILNALKMWGFFVHLFVRSFTNIYLGQGNFLDAKTQQ